MTNRVMGGLLLAELSWAGFMRGYRNVEASQSSLKSGSSSFSEMSAGRRVDKRAKCVVSESKGSG